MAEQALVSVHGPDPGWPFNEVVKAVVAAGETLTRHQRTQDGGQEALTWCPGPSHKPKDQGGGTEALKFIEHPDGAVRAFCFKKDDIRPILDYFGLSRADLRTDPGGQLLEGGVWIDPHRGTDSANADLLISRYGTELRYAEGLGWLVWDGRRWARDEARPVTLARKAVRVFYQLAQAEDDSDRRKDLAKAAAEAERSSRIFGMLKLAASDPRIRVRAAQLDVDPWLLNVANGTLDLRAGQLRAHARDDLITKLAPAEYLPDAVSDDWSRFLAAAAEGKPGLVEFLARAAGYTLTGLTRDDAVFIAHGPGGAGKTTFVEALAAAMGDYAGRIGVDALVETGTTGGGHSEEVARLAGRRLVAVAEADEHKRLREGLFKWLTGGDTITASYKYGHGFDFTPRFHLWLYSNEIPRMRADDSGLRRRVHKLPFDNPPERPDRDLKDRLRRDPANRAAVLAWAVAGCLAWQQDGLDPPACVQDATTAMWDSMDQAGRFLDDCLVFGEAYSITNKALQDAYDTWAEEEGIPHRFRISVNNNRRAQALEARGCSKYRKGSERGWVGVGLPPSIPPTPPMAPPPGDGRDDRDDHDATSMKSYTCARKEDFPQPSSRSSRSSSPPPEGRLLPDPAPTPAARVEVAGERPRVAPVWIHRAEEIRAVLPDILRAPAVALDLETTGLDPFDASVRLVQLATTPTSAFVIDCRSVPLAALQPVLDHASRIVGHNLKFDLRHLAAAGLTLPADLGHRLRDTMLASQLLGAGDPTQHHSLDQVARRYLGLELDKHLQASDWTGELSGEQVAYAARDAAVLLPLREMLGAHLADERLERVAEIENRALPGLVWLEDAGIGFDLDRLAGLTARATSDLDHAKERLDQAAAALIDHEASANLLGEGRKVNWGSPKQVLAALHRAGLTVTSTAEDVLRNHAADSTLAALLLEFRHAQRLVGMYGAEFAKHVRADTGRIHADYRQLGSAAGRMSCTGPNLQQVPNHPDYRGCFRAPPGRLLVKADYSQIELRLAAQISGDQRLLEAYEAGEDLHALTARQVLAAADPDHDKGARQAAKALNFGLIYGMGADGLRRSARTNYGVEMTPEQAREYRQRFFATYPGLRAWHQQQPDAVTDTRTLAGRRRLGVDRFTKKLNSPVQGSGADGLKLALALLAERRAQAPAGTVPVAVVHDEIVVETPAEHAHEAEAWLCAAMTEGMANLLTSVPVVVETTIAPDWAGPTAPSPDEGVPR